MKLRHDFSFWTLLLVGLCGGGEAQKPASGLITSSAIAVDEAAEVAFAVDAAHDRVLRLDLRTGDRRFFEVGKEPVALALDATAQRLYAVDAGAGMVSVLDTQSGALLAQPRTDARPYTIAIDRRLRRAYVSNTFSDQVTVIDTRGNTATAMPWGSKDTILVDEARGRVFFTSYEDASLMVLDEASGAVTRFPVAKHNWGMALVPETGHVLIAEVGGNSVMDVEPIAQQVRRIAVGAMPDALAVAGDFVYVANRESNTVSRVRLREGVVDATQHVGSHPQAVAAKQGVVWVANTSDRTVEVWNDACPARAVVMKTAGPPYSLALAGGLRAVVAETGEQAAEVLHAPGSVESCEAK